jgi:hypothetical protein
MTERTDTRPNITPEGRRKFTCAKVPVKKLSEGKNKPYYEFTFEYMDGTTLREHKEFVMAWMAGPLLKAFGFPEVEPGIYEWEKETCLGKMIEATIIHEADKKDASKVRSRMTEVTAVANEEIPF